MAREILFDLGKMITDRLEYKFGFKKLTEDDPEYIILDRACSNDEIAEIMLKMGLRKPKTTAQIAKLTGKSEERVTELLTDGAMHGIVEYNWENPQHEKQWYVQIFVPGIAEMTNMVLPQVEKYPELASSFDQMISRISAVTVSMPKFSGSSFSVFTPRTISSVPSAATSST